MSLIRQLWMAIGFLMIFAFIGSFFVSNYSAQTYLSEQLYQKNIDTSGSLALSLSSAGGDPIAAELVLSAQFDTGHYEQIRFISTENEVLLDKVSPPASDSAPSWLIKLFPIQPPAGVAYVTNGWQQMGTLELKSQTGFAYAELWQNTKRLFLYFLLTAALAGLIGGFLLKTITTPLNNTVEQAKAIGERRFIKTTLPKTLEFRAVVQAMNQLSDRVHQMLSEESASLDKWRNQEQIDPITRTLNRAPFLERLNALLMNQDESSVGTLLLLRFKHLVELNRSEGREVMDTLLQQFGEAMQTMANTFPNAFSGRLNGSDFALLISARETDKSTLAALQEMLLVIAKNLHLEEKTDLPGAMTLYSEKDTVSDILSRADAALALAESFGRNALQVAENTVIPKGKNHSLSYWKETLENAFVESTFFLEKFPVCNRQLEVLHEESPVRFQSSSQETFTAGQFLHWIHRFHWGARLDTTVVELALQQLRNHPSALCINLSSQLLEDKNALNIVINHIKSQPDVAKLLWLEAPEYGVYPHIENYRYLCNQLKPIGCHLGIEHAGPEFARIGELHDLGIDYIKIDSSIVHGIDDHPANQIFLRGICTIVHSIGLMAIAEGVESEAEWNMLLTLGIDGGTGVFFTHIKA